MLLAQDGILINLRGEGTGATALATAVIHDQVEVVRCLLEEEGMSINEPTEYSDENCHGGNPLTFAALRGNEEILLLLLNHPDINVEYQDAYGRTALNNAAGCDHANIVRLLLERDCIDVNTRDNDGRTPLITAAQGGCERSVKALLDDARTDTSWRNEYNETALVLAALNGHKEIVAMLLQSNRDFPKASIDEALEYAKDEVRQLLLQELRRFSGTAEAKPFLIPMLPSPRMPLHDSVNELLHRGLNEKGDGGLARANDHYKLGPRVYTATRDRAIYVFCLPLTADEQYRVTTEPEVKLPAPPDVVYPTASLEVRLVAYTTKNALTCMDWSGKEIWRYNFNIPSQEEQYMNGSATPGFSADGQVLWLYQPEQAWKGRDFIDTIFAFDALRGTLLSTAELGSSGHGASFFTQHGSQEMLLEVGEGQERSCLYQTQLRDGAINVFEYQSVGDSFVLQVLPTLR
ncbi:ankyrin repeat domain-containing protein [Aspergillus lucknowensis]|uniref:Ankyrin repeat-containing domain protein n=1 Tax=Aspergillus lucknowensis TaxID=176173 RepID=A0ABR4L613_9EURO